jgi:hypothetical protein
LRLFKELINDRKKFAADAIGEEAVITDVAEITVWDMRDETGNEIQNGKRDGLLSVGIMVKILKDDLFAVV